jgi:ribosomal protein L11 methyltransferase
MPADALGWRLTMPVPTCDVGALLDALEPRADAVAAFVAELDEDQEPLAWTVELQFAAEPVMPELEAALAEVMRGQRIRAGALRLERLTEADWVAMGTLQQPPVRAGRFLVHGAHARGQIAPGALAIQIDAGLAFGSGEHATTQACLLALDRLARTHRYRRVLDLGCGSAVLAIAALKARPACGLATDIDPVAVRVAAENARLNRVAARLRCVEADGLAGAERALRGPFDLVLANILADPLIELAPRLARRLAPGARLVLSGFLHRQADMVAAAYRSHGLRPVERIEVGAWSALVLAWPARVLRGRRGFAISPRPSTRGATADRARSHLPRL